MSSFNEFKKKIESDIKNKGFSYVDKKLLDKVKKSEEKTKFKAIGNIEENYSVFGKTYKAKKIGRGANYILYDDSVYGELVRVSKVTDLLYEVLDYSDKKVNRYFRGQKAHYDLIPSLFREQEWVEKEMEYNARVYNDRPGDFADCHSTFDKLVRLKHYDQPSRLLDVTASPLVALFFACFDSKDKKYESAGVIYEAYCEKTKEKISVSSDTVVMLTAMTNTPLNLKENEKKSSLGIPCSSDKDFVGKDCERICPKRGKEKDQCCYNGCWPNKNKEYEECPENKQEDGGEGQSKIEIRTQKSILKEGSWAYRYIGELSHQCKKEGMTIYWDDVCFNELNQCILVKPPLNNDRIVRQQGCFIMCGMNPEDIYKPPKSMYEFFKKPTGDKKATLYFVLPKDRKKILDELKLLGMDEYYFFPELEREIRVVSALQDDKQDGNNANKGKTGVKN